jgi:long-subunit fatty acid transport protein
MKTLIKLTLLFFIVVGNTFSQSVKDVSKKGTAAAPFLSISQGAKATAMGSAFVSIANDASAIYWNPAGLAKLQGAGAMFDRTTWFADVNYNFVSGYFNLGDMGTIGLSFTSSEYGDMKVTTIEAPDGTGELFSATDAVFALSYAMSLTDNFAIGFTPKFIYQSIWKMNAIAVAIDLGVQYVTPFDGIILAMSISNFGTKMKLSGNSNLVLHDLDLTSTGNNGNIPAYLQTEDWALPLNFRVGLGYSFHFSDENQLTLAVDALHPSDNYESVNAGAEYSYNDFLFLRGGYKSLFLADTEESFALGFGVKQALLNNLAIKLDYAYQDFGRLNNIQKFTVGIVF